MKVCEQSITKLNTRNDTSPHLPSLVSHQCPDQVPDRYKNDPEKREVLANAQQKIKQYYKDLAASILEMAKAEKNLATEELQIKSWSFSS